MKIFSLFTCCLISIFTFGQATVVNDLDVAILVPKLDKDIPLDISDRLERKITNIFTQNDIINNQQSTFEVHSLLSLVGFSQIEGSTNETTAELSLSFKVENRFSGQAVMVFTKTISGYGKSQDAAIKRAVNNIRPQKAGFLKFIQKLQDKINNYYENHCDEIVVEANRAIQNNEQEKAIALLSSIPNHSDCRKANQSLLDQTYNEFQNSYCQSLIQEVETAILKKDYKDAINLLGKVDANGPCKADAKRLLHTINEKVEAQNNAKMKFLNKVYSDNVEIEKARQKSMKSISNTYIEGIKKD